MARHSRTATIDQTSEEAMAASHRIAADLIEGNQAVYWLSTGFGALADRYTPPHQQAALQIRLIRSHAAMVGEEVETEMVRAMMLLRAATLAEAS